MFASLKTFRRPRHVAEPADLGAFDRRPLRALLTANAVSQIGNSLTSLALPWFVLQTTESAAKIGLVSGVMAIGGMVASFFGGPLADRLGLRRTSVMTDIGCLILMGSIPILHRAEALSFPLVVLIAFLIACFNAPGDAARFALVPGFATRAGIELEQASAADRGIARAALLVGPLVAGILIAVLGPSNVLLLDAATFAISALLVGFGAVSGGGLAPAVSKPPDAPEGYFSQLRAGATFVRRTRIVLAIASLVAICNTLDAALITVVMPSYANEVWGSSTAFGALVSSLGAGALLGTFVFAKFANRVPMRLMLLGGGALGALLLYGALALTLPLGLIVLAGFAGGLVGGPIYPLIETVVQKETPPELYGRVFGALQAFSVVGIPIGTIVAGGLVDGPGLIFTIVVLGACYIAVTLGAFGVPAFRLLDRDRSAVHGR